MRLKSALALSLISKFDDTNKDNPEEDKLNALSPNDREIVESLFFTYIDPQGDKMTLDSNEDLMNMLHFARIAEQKLLKLIMTSNSHLISQVQ